MIGMNEALMLARREDILDEIAALVPGGVHRRPPFLKSALRVDMVCQAGVEGPPMGRVSRIVVPGP